jgi:hypothetical protein
MGSDATLSSHVVSAMTIVANPRISANLNPRLSCAMSPPSTDWNFKARKMGDV